MSGSDLLSIRSLVALAACAVGVAGATLPVLGPPAAPVVLQGLQRETLAIADVDSDGNPDVLVVTGEITNDPGGTIRRTLLHCLRGLGDGGFAPVQVTAFPGYPHRSIVHLRVADFDGDGAPDVLYLQRTEDLASDELVQLRGQGDCGFDPPVATPWTLGALLRTGDLDGDGDLDATATGSLTTRVALRGPGGLVAGAALHTGSSSCINLGGDGGCDTVGVWGRDAPIADLDGDGLADVLVHLGDTSVDPGFNRLVERGDDAVRWHRGLGAGAFAVAVEVPLGTRATRLSSHDLDRDGRADLAALGDDRLVITFGDAGAAWTAQQVALRGADAFELAERGGDWTVGAWHAGRTLADSWFQLAMLTPRGASVVGPRTLAPNGWREGPVAFADLDGDGMDDAVTLVEVGLDTGVVVQLGTTLAVDTPPAPTGAVGVITVASDATVSALASALVPMTDAEGHAVGYEVVTAPAEAMAFRYDPVDRRVYYRPKPFYRGPDQFTLKATDGALDSAPFTVQVIEARPPLPEPPEPDADDEDGGGGASDAWWLGLLAIALALRRKTVVGGEVVFEAAD